jgi:hypothetical protein
MVELHRRHERDLRRVQDDKREDEVYRRGTTHGNAFLIPAFTFYYPDGYSERLGDGTYHLLHLLIILARFTIDGDAIPLGGNSRRG